MRMKVSLRYLHSPDLPNLADDTPADPDCFCILIQAMVGPTDGPGEESFDFLVCTPKWLQEELGKAPYVLGRFHLLIPQYDFQVIRIAIEKICSEIDAPDWSSAAAMLGRHGKWEFEDYKA